MASRLPSGVRRFASLTAVLAPLLTPASAGAVPVPASAHRAASAHATKRSSGSLADPAHLWATVDICNTQAHPHVLGLRASMPGTGHRKQRMFMRFRAQFVDAGGQWTVLPGADSGFHDIGSGVYRERRSGWSFVFLPTPGGVQHTLRGLVDFEWRRHKKVVHRLQVPTTAGHPSGTQGDPPDFSAASCQT